MRNHIITAALLFAFAAQGATLTERQVRDPKVLTPWLAALSTSIATNENIVIPGTLGVTGAATFTGNAIANELDARTATALLLGKATATSVTLGASDAGVTIPGTLGVTGVATFTAAPKLTATNTAAAVTLTMTNAPTACDAGKATPIYLNVTVGTTTYVVPAWPITP